MRAWASCRKGDRLEHCRQYAEQKGINLAAALARFGLEEPQIPDGFEYVWHWFFELAQTRTGNGFAWNPISWAEMDAWANISGVPLQTWLMKCFRAMDQEWLAAMNEKPEKDTGKNNGGIRAKSHHRG